jgi:cytochrome P450
MAMFPDVQKKAQEELDRVVGTDRVARYDDEPSLPYIQALCREVLRWKPAVPLGVLHAARAEDVYNGYYIPQGKFEAIHAFLTANSCYRGHYHSK